MTTGDEAVVDRLMAGWEALDADAIAACLHADATWHNMPHGAVVGRAAIAAAIGRFLGDMAACAFEVRHGGTIAPGIVMNERVDRFRRHDGTTLDIPVAGMFVVEDGLVRAWRDYYDGRLG